MLLVADVLPERVCSRVTWAELREKVPNVLSRCHTKRRAGARGRTRPSFGMTPT